MRTYGKLVVDFWSIGKGVLLRGDTVALSIAPYLFACPHGNMIGLFRLPLAYVAEDLGIPLEGASKGLRRVCGAGIAAFDEGSSQIFVFGAGKRNLAERVKATDNRLRNVRELLSGQKRNVFYNDFLAMYAEPWGLQDLLPEAPSKGLTKPLRSQKQEQKQKQKQEDDVVVLRGRDDGDDDPAAALPGQDPVKKPGHVTGIDACRVYCETIGQTYAYGANARSFDAIAAAANDHAPDAERALRDATRHHRVWATGDGKGRAGPGHLARGFHRDLAEARGTLAPKPGPAKPSSEDDFEEVTPAWLEGQS